MLIKLSDLIKKYGIKPKSLIHCGGHFGEEAKDYHDNGFKSVIWIECMPDAFEVLKKNVARYKHGVIKACLGDEDGKEVTFHVANNEGQSSSYLDLSHHKIAHPEVKYIAEYTLKTVRLDTLLTHNKVDLQQYDFINMDLQGVELIALKGMGELLHKINYAYLEVNEKELYKGCALLPEVDEYMGSFGLTRVEMQRTNFGWNDAFYLRK